jgi:hypothetical protein
MGKNGTKIIKLFLRHLFLILFLQIQLAESQAQTREVKKAERNYARLLEKEKKDYDKKRKATIKHRYEIQSKDVQARMKQTEKRSQQHGRKQKESWIKNIFKKKKYKAKRKRKPR